MRYKQVYRERKGDNGNWVKHYPLNSLLNGMGIKHDPKNPRFDDIVDPDGLTLADRAKIGRYGSTGKHRSFPLILLKASAFFVNEIYYKPLEYSLTRYFNDDGVPYKVKSQRREAIAKLGAAMIMHYNIGYGMIGKPGKDGEFIHYSVESLASFAGLSYDRAKRAFQVFRDKGCLTCKKIVEENDDGSFVSRSYVKHLTFGFWDMLGFGKWIKKERKKRYKKSMENAGSEPKTLTKRERVMGAMIGSVVTGKLIADVDNSVSILSA